MGLTDNSDDEKRMDAELLAFIHGDDKEESQPQFVDKTFPTCTAWLMVRNNQSFMNSVLMQDLLGELSCLNDDEVSLNINAINYIYSDINSGKLSSLSDSRIARDKLRHAYVQEYKRDLNTPSPQQVIPKKGVWRSICRILKGADESL